jgi:hypothetical protein
MAIFDRRHLINEQAKSSPEQELVEELQTLIDR